MECNSNDLHTAKVVLVISKGLEMTLFRLSAIRPEESAVDGIPDVSRIAAHGLNQSERFLLRRGPVSI